MLIGRRLRAMLALAVATVTVLAVMTATAGSGGAQEEPRVVVDADATSDAVDASVTRGVGEMFAVAVQIDGLEGEGGLGTAAFRLVYDPVILRAVRIDPVTEILDAGLRCQVQTIVVAGVAELGCRLPQLPGDGPGGDRLRLGEIEFEAIASGSSALTLESATVGLGSGFCISDVDTCELPSTTYVGAAVNVAGEAPAADPSATEELSPLPSGEVVVLLELEPTEGISKGDEFRINARAKNVPEPGLAGFVLELQFNEKVLETVSVVASEDVEGMSCPGRLEAEPGRAHLTCVFLPPPARGPSGDLVLAVVTLRAKGYGEADLRSPVVALGGPNNACYFSTEITGEGCDRPVADSIVVPSVEISGSGTPWLLVGAVVVGALIIGAAGVALVARRSRASGSAA